MKELLLLVVVTIAAVGHASAQVNGKHEKEFQDFLAKLDAAQLKFHNGDPSALEELYSHSDDVTLAGGTGGPIEKGWANVKKRLDVVTTHYEGGTQTNERISVNVSGDLACVIQYEHIIFRVPGQTADSKRDYRISMVFRYEKDGWKLLHRQADTQMQMQTPK